jgi:Flp pilus assembly protein TadG
VNVRRPRRGGIAVLTAVLLVVLLGMVAFAVDVGWIVLAQADLQYAADAAALAGAGQLMEPSVQFSLPGQSTTNQGAILSAAEASASASATKFAGYNGAGSTKSLVLLSKDIEYGFTDANGNYTKYTGNSTYANSFPNTIRVTLRLDGSSGGNPPLGLFFGSVFGQSSTNLAATASSTIYTGTLDTGRLLPITYDRNFWNNFLATGKSPDGTVYTDANGNPEMKVFPSPNEASGNFGYLSLDDSSNSASAISGWLTSGPSAANLQTLEQNGLLPLSSHDNTLWDWKGSPGFKASDLGNSSLQKGNVFIMPLFNPVVGTPGNNYQAANKNPGPATPGQGAAGSNAYYQVVQFVAVQVSDVLKGGNNNGYLYVEPYGLIDPTATIQAGTVTPAQPGSSNSLVTTFTTPKLSQ